MHVSRIAMAALLPAAAVAATANIVLSNDDGWAEANIRALYDALTAAGDSVVLSAPADDQSGEASSDAPPTPRARPCEFDSCPAHGPAYGRDASDARLNYVNSRPVTSMRYGIRNLSAEFFGGKPDLAVSGINVGANAGNIVLVSGTVGAAVEAVKEGVPALAFSGNAGSQISYATSPKPNYVGVYATLARNVTQTLLASGGKPYLPAGIWLNVNFPPSTASRCTRASDFKFVLSRIAQHGIDPNWEDEDDEDEDEDEYRDESRRPRHDQQTVCDGTLPREEDVIEMPGCYASVSVSRASDKNDADGPAQQLVQKKLSSILSCLPSSS